MCQRYSFVIALFLVAFVVAGCAAYQRMSLFVPEKFATGEMQEKKIAMQKAQENDDTYFETSSWRVVLKKSQKYLGASVIRLKRVCGDIACLTKEEWEELRGVIVALEDAARNAFGATMFNTENLMNHAFQNPPYAPLMHLHFTPRYEAPVAFAGEIFTDELFGHRARLGEIRNMPEFVREQIKSALRNHLHNPSRP